MSPQFRPALEHPLSPGPRPSGLSEAFALPARDTDTWKTVLQRVCYKQPISCPTEVANIAMEMVREARRRALDSLRAQRALLSVLGQIQGPKDVVLISEELVVPPYLSEQGDIEAEVREVGKAAAQSRVSTYVLQLHKPLFDASTAGIPQTAGADAALRAAGLQDVAGITGGSLLLVSGSANALQVRGLRASSCF
jgi:hypothetical protein